MKLLKIIFVIVFFPGYLIVWLGKFTREKGKIRSSKNRAKRIHFWGPLIAIGIYFYLWGLMGA